MSPRRLPEPDEKDQEPRWDEDPVLGWALAVWQLERKDLVALLDPSFLARLPNFTLEICRSPPAPTIVTPALRIRSRPSAPSPMGSATVFAMSSPSTFVP
jgi:hypothetical protein